MGTGLLIAEPDAELRRIYERLPDVLGFHVETAGDGLECWAKLQEHRPNVLVIDMAIRWGGGDGVLARLREPSHRALRPAVFVTGDAPAYVLSSQLGISTWRCFRKPFRLNTLLDSVCVAVAARRPEVFCH